MNILAITYCFVPLEFPATYRLLKWFSRLSELGHGITVVSVEPASFPGPKDDVLHALVPKGVEVITAPSRENTLLYRVLRRRGELFYRLFQPHKMEWYAPAKKALGSLDLRQFDVVFTCSHPPVCHLLGSEVSRRADLPWVTFFSDPWTDNPYYRQQAKRIRDYNLALERSVLTSADAIIVTCDEVKRLMLAKFGLEGDSRVSVLPHCFKTDWPTSPRSLPQLEAGVVNIVLIGNFYGPRSPMALLGVLRKMDQRNRLGDRIRLQLFGRMLGEDRRSELWKDVGHFAVFHGAVDYLRGLSLMQAADYLLLVDAPVEPGHESVFFPSKLADYLGAGTPVIGLTPKQGASARILRETGHVACDYDDLGAVEDIFAQMAAGTLRITPKPAEVQKYDYRRVGDMLAAILHRSRAERFH